LGLQACALDDMVVSSGKFETPGVRIIHGVSVTDPRGRFCKALTGAFFGGKPPRFEELFWSESRRGVVRGFHLQMPPAAHDKMVFCVSGRVFDVVLDVRADSPSYGKPESFELVGGNGVSLFIPAGVAHAFQALSDKAILGYLTTTAHSPAHDSGVHWASVGVHWPITPRLVSERDQAMPRFDDFESPFRLNLEAGEP
jgi:dTDP-4-dehydrorhamnose 3,5-epimerase